MLNCSTAGIAYTNAAPPPGTNPTRIADCAERTAVLAIAVRISCSVPEFEPIRMIARPPVRLAILFSSFSRSSIFGASASCDRRPDIWASSDSPLLLSIDVLSRVTLILLARPHFSKEA